MKIKICSLLCVSAHFLAPAAKAQGTFQNLGFESAVLVPVTGNTNTTAIVQFAPTFPGWSGYIGGIEQTNALYNFTLLDTSAISIINTDPPGWGIGVIQG